MTQKNLSVRPMREADFEYIVDYFLNAGKDFLGHMGVDTAKLPEKKEWTGLLENELLQKTENKQLFYVIWLLDNKPVGHSNINKIIFSVEANLHLHVWKADNRKKGIGFELIKMSLPYYFDNFQLKNLYCEPYALNPAPNKVLQKLGFEFIKQYETTPGWINFHQPVNRWCMSYEKYQLLY